MNLRQIAPTLALMACAACLLPERANAAEPAVFDNIRVETLAGGLDVPWSIAFLPDGRWLITERSGALRVMQNGQLLDEPVRGVPPVYAHSQGGLMEVLADKDFAQNQRIYLSLSHGTPDANATRVVRARLDGMQLRDVTPIFTASPLKDTPVHYGGRMTWLPDDTLLLTIGDGFDYREAAQQPSSHLGSVVRIRADGSVPPDNPFKSGSAARPETWSYGHRNPQGLVFASGHVFLHEHGAQGGDEINLIKPGRNYGWPLVTYGIDYTGARITPYTELPGLDLEQPLLHWTPSIAPSGMAVYSGDLFPQWRGDLLVTSLVERTLRHVKIKPDATTGNQTVLLRGLGKRLRHVAVAPDGSVILLAEKKGTETPQGEVLRLTPASAR